MLQRKLRMDVSRQGKYSHLFSFFTIFTRRKRRLINQNKFEEITKKRYSDLFRWKFLPCEDLFGKGKVSKLLKRIDYRNRASAIF